VVKIIQNKAQARNESNVQTGLFQPGLVTQLGVTQNSLVQISGQRNERRNIQAYTQPNSKTYYLTRHHHHHIYFRLVTMSIIKK